MPSEEQKLIEKYLYRWFQTNDALVIPELGTLEAIYQEAHLQPGVNKLSPPNKSFKFDGSGNLQDNEFAEYIAHQENISPEEADKHIQQFVTSLKMELGIQKRYLLEGFGTFIYNNEGNIDFEALPEVNYEGESFGLPEVFLKTGSWASPTQPVAEESESNANAETKIVETETEKQAENDKDYVLEEPPAQEQKGTRRIFYIAALILLLVTVTFAVLIMTDNNPFGKGQSFFSDGSELEEELDDAEPEDQLDREAGIEEENLTENDSNQTSNNNNEAENTEEENSDNAEETVKLPPNPEGGNISTKFRYDPTPPSRPSQVMIKTATSKFFAILGSFDNSGNAYSYYNNLSKRGIPNIKIIAPNAKSNRYRVSYGIHNSKEEADKNGKEFEKLYGMSFWIHKY